MEQQYEVKGRSSSIISTPLHVDLRILCDVAKDVAGCVGEELEGCIAQEVSYYGSSYSKMRHFVCMCVDWSCSSQSNYTIG